MSQPYVGEIRIFAGNFAPAGWMLCQGQLLPISEFETLFNLIGTTYGGDGQSTFALPDLQSRIPVHQGTTLGTTFTIGESGGVESVTLTTQQIPVHSHTPQAENGQNGNLASPSNAVWAQSSRDEFGTTAPATALSPNAVQAAGGAQPHDNMPPFLVINFIISMFGIFPSQN
jgi:microcystin-dependent protein